MYSIPPWFLNNMVDQRGSGVSIGEFECKTIIAPSWMVFPWMLHVCHVQYVLQYNSHLTHQ